MPAIARFGFAMVAGLACLAADPVRAQTNPNPSYAFAVRIVDTGNCARPRINNGGEIVYAKRTGDVSRVWSSARGAVSGGPADMDPDINDGGEIIWRFGDGGQGANGIGSSDRGTLYLSSGQDPYYGSHRINNTGEVVWSSGGGRVYSITRGFLTSPPTGNDRDLSLNNGGEVAYRAYRWTAPMFSIQTTVQGVLASMDSSDLRYPEINDTGEVVWVQGSNVCSSTRGILRSAASLDSYVAINNGGEVVWVEDGQVFSSVRGMLTTDPAGKSRPDINDRGDVVWRYADGSIGLASWAPIAPEALPPRAVGARGFTARWAWVDAGGPEGELCVASDAAFKNPVPGYEARYVVNGTECPVTNLLKNTDYWYRVRRLTPDAGPSAWSSRMKVRTGQGLPVLKNVPAGGPVARGVVQELAISNLVSGTGKLAVKSSNTNAVMVMLTTNALTFHYLWSSAQTAKVTVTLSHPASGYSTAYRLTLRQATGNVAKVGESALTNDGARVAQEVTFENRTGEMIHGVRIRAQGLAKSAWLVNRTGLDPASQAPILEIPCVLPAGSQLVARLVYSKAYEEQAATRPAKVAAWAIMTPVHGAMPVEREVGITRQERYDGLWLLRLPADWNRLYRIEHSDDGGANWAWDAPLIRAAGQYLMWLDIDEGAPAERLYRVTDAGL